MDQFEQDLIDGLMKSRAVKKVEETVARMRRPKGMTAAIGCKMGLTMDKSFFDSMRDGASIDSIKWDEIMELLLSKVNPSVGFAVGCITNRFSLSTESYQRAFLVGFDFEGEDSDQDASYFIKMEHQNPVIEIYAIRKIRMPFMRHFRDFARVVGVQPRDVRFRIHTVSSSSTVPVYSVFTYT